MGSWVTLAVPNKGIRKNNWRSEIRQFAYKSHIPFVFHSKHAKFFGECKPPASQFIWTKDKTEHFDFNLLEKSHELLERCIKQKYKIASAKSIVFHYLTNFEGKGYKSEIRYLKRRLKRLSWLDRHWTAEDDHGWEIDVLKESGLIPYKKK